MIIGIALLIFRLNINNSYNLKQNQAITDNMRSICTLLTIGSQVLSVIWSYQCVQGHKIKKNSLGTLLEIVNVIGENLKKLFFIFL